MKNKYQNKQQRNEKTKQNASYFVDPSLFIPGNYVVSEISNKAVIANVGQTLGILIEVFEL